MLLLSCFSLLSKFLRKDYNSCSDLLFFFTKFTSLPPLFMIWIDQFCRFLLLRIIYEQAVTRSVKTENQDAFQRLLPFDIGKSLFPKGVWFCYPLFVQV
ncbi:unnamed protein product [Brassica rapa subsp. trilocularis]|uniref:(rape) hypothetical protein n=1 Tax=Brassica napus TaxID=3708 RepID=A0A816ZDE5_BRANA|nr:unnamed protein product [Brassica napus]